MYMYIYMYIYIYACMYIYKYVNLHIYLYTHLHYIGYAHSQTRKPDTAKTGERGRVKGIREKRAESEVCVGGGRVKDNSGLIDVMELMHQHHVHSYIYILICPGGK